MSAPDLQAAYVIHSRRYGESGLLADLLTQRSGRVAAVIRGALKGRRNDRTAQAFQPLLIALRGRGEVMTLTRLERDGPPLTMNGRRLYCGLYVNELLMHLTVREDPCSQVFDDYVAVLHDLAGGVAIETALRRFEVSLLEHLGIGLALTLDIEGKPIVPSSRYYYDVSSGARPVDGEGDDSVAGQTLLALYHGRLDDERVLRETRRLMRRVIDFHLGGRALRSRELFR